MTIWLEAHNLIEAGWTQGVPEADNCYCAGGGIAKAITGNPHDMYDDDIDTPVGIALSVFADYVGAPTAASPIEDRGWWACDRPAERVFVWNDHQATKETVLKALMELHEAEVAAANA